MAWGKLRALECDGCFGSPARLAVLGGCDVTAPQDPFRYRPHPSAYAGARERRAKSRPAKVVLISGGVPCGCGCGEITNVVTRTERARGRVVGTPYRFLSGHNLRLLRGRGLTAAIDHETISAGFLRPSHRRKRNRATSKPGRWVAPW